MALGSGRHDGITDDLVMRRHELAKSFLCGTVRFRWSSRFDSDPLSRLHCDWPSRGSCIRRSTSATMASARFSSVLQTNSAVPIGVP